MGNRAIEIEKKMEGNSLPACNFIDVRTNRNIKNSSPSRLQGPDIK